MITESVITSGRSLMSHARLNINFFFDKKIVYKTTDNDDDRLDSIAGTNLSISSIDESFVCKERLK